MESHQGAARSPFIIRDAEPCDAAGLVSLWNECMEADGLEAATQGLWRSPSVDEAQEALGLFLTRPSSRVVVAETEGEIVGATVCEMSTLTPISMIRTLIVTEIQVSPRFRRRSVARTLLNAVAAHGVEQGGEVVVAAIPVEAKEPHRYLTKIGFAQIAAVRAISMSRLQARTTHKPAKLSVTDKLIVKRRSQLRRRGAQQRSE